MGVFQELAHAIYKIEVVWFLPSLFLSPLVLSLTLPLCTHLILRTKQPACRWEATLICSPLSYLIQYGRDTFL